MGGSTNEHETSKELIDSYAWKLHLINQSYPQYRINIISNYGIEANQPTGKGGHSDKVGKEVTRKIMREQRILGYVKDINIINYCASQLEGLERELIEMLISGMSLNKAGLKLGISRRKIQNAYMKVLECITNTLNENME